MRFAYSLLLAATLSLSSFATSVYVNLTGMDPERSTTLDIRVLDPSTSQYVNWTVSAGGILAVTGGNAAEDYFCVDLFHDISVPGTYLDNVSAPNAALNQNRVAWLLDNILPTFSKDASISQLQGAALQLAIWDIVTDGGDGFSKGSLQTASTTNAAVITWAKQYLAESIGKSAMDVGVYTVTTVNKDGKPYQVLMGDTMGPGVPEPATFGFASIGLAALILVHRRRHANSSRNTEQQPVPDRLS